MVADTGDVRYGAFLTDGHRLFCVLRADNGCVTLEDCANPEADPTRMRVSSVMSVMELVRPDTGP